MYRLSKIAEDFFFLQFTGTSWPTSSNIFLIRDRLGLNLIDTGLNREEFFAGVLRCIEELGFKTSYIHTVLLTHGHTDHIAGIHPIRRFCNPRILIPELSFAEATDPREQEKAVLPGTVREAAPRLKNFDILGEFANSCGKWLLAPRECIPFQDKDKIRLGRYLLQAIHCPGHDAGHTAFYVPDMKILLSGDLLRAAIPGNALPWYSSTGGGVRAYLRSLKNFEGFDAEMVYPSHGSLKGPLAPALRRTQGEILKRHSIIIETLKRGPRTCEDLDKLLYSPQALQYCPWYSSSTLAHLEELQEDGKLVREGLLFHWSGV
jgi:glyoxylase-like metal-dependent hydrolase (beta-lactamase superfamily II)